MHVEKLISVVQRKAALYNTKMKEHHAREVTDALWTEVAAEMNASVADCKTKWNILRSAYARHVRESMRTINGITYPKKKKWYLADKLEFLRKFTGINKKPFTYTVWKDDIDYDTETNSDENDIKLEPEQISERQPFSEAQQSSEAQQFLEIQHSPEVQQPSEAQQSTDVQHFLEAQQFSKTKQIQEALTNSDSQQNSEVRRFSEVQKISENQQIPEFVSPNKIEHKNSTPEIISPPPPPLQAFKRKSTQTYTESYVDRLPPKLTAEHMLYRLLQEDPNLQFFRSILPDLATLSSRRQRKFKAQVLTILNEYMDEEEAFIGDMSNGSHKSALLQSSAPNLRIAGIVKSEPEAFINLDD